MPPPKKATVASPQQMHDLLMMADQVLDWTRIFSTPPDQNNFINDYNSKFGKTITPSPNQLEKLRLYKSEIRNYITTNNAAQISAAASALTVCRPSYQKSPLLVPVAGTGSAVVPQDEIARLLLTWSDPTTDPGDQARMKKLLLCLSMCKTADGELEKLLADLLTVIDDQ